MKKIYYYHYSLFIIFIAVSFFACNEKKDFSDSPRWKTEEKSALDDSLGQDMAPDDSIYEEPQPQITVSLEVIAETFPEKIPIYSPSMLITSYISSLGDSAMATFVTEDDMDSVIRFYREDFQKKGWILSGETSITGAHLIQAERNTVSINVAIKQTKETSTPSEYLW